MTVGEMLARMSAWEFQEWLVFYKLDPFGELRQDMRAGLCISPLLNTVREGLGNAQVSRPTDFIWEFDRKPPKTQPVNEMKMLCKAIAEGAKISADRRRGKK
jgi:hypothetical protein